MWAPADLFSHILDIFLFPLKQAASYFYQHLVVLSGVLIAAALLIALATVLGNRHARKT